MKIFWILLMSGCLVLAGMQVGFAQHKVSAASVKKYKSPTLARAEELVAMTKAGYFKNLYSAKAAAATNARSALDCGTPYLCRLGDALPVSLVQFNGNRIDAERVELIWETSSETENKGFQIERSPTGAGGFVSVGFVDGGGNSSQASTYQMTDLNNSTLVTYYRLKQLDYDGTHENSRIIAVAGFKHPFTLTAIPNPTRSGNIHFQVKAAENVREVELVIVNARGVIVYQNKKWALNAAKKISVNKIAGMTAGLYQAKIVSGEEISSTSFVITD